jgi:hypothetical protein
VFVRDRVRVECTALEIAGGQNEVVEAAQDEASPTTLPGEPPKAKNLLLGECQSLLGVKFPEALEPVRRHPRITFKDFLQRGRAHSPAFAR